MIFVKRLIEIVSGGKVTILAGSGETPLDAVAAVHPA